MDKKLIVLDQKASDNAYLHKDFHGALCYAIKYLVDQFGHAATESYLKQVGRTVFAPLAERIKTSGLSALETHFRDVFEKENGNFTVAYEDGQLVFRIEKCPAIAHLKQSNQLFTERFCESTVIVNAAICQLAGIRCSCEYQPGQGKCIQKFWKETK
ncbi:hypothetical protein JXJ21_25425 [candidate division KSB1 bacterium]|nr:hypothetical protein [candidate division KSB1 bacterium]